MAKKTIYSNLLLLFSYTLISFILLELIQHYFMLQQSILILCLFAINTIFILIWYYLRVYKIRQKTDKILELFSKGVTYQGLMDIETHYSTSDKHAYDRVLELSKKEAIIIEKNRQSQYLALQNQINPHFLYNTLDSIRSEALIADLDSIADMTEALSKFFQYTISNTQNLVTLEDELRNVNNYFSIQKYRFGDKISLKIIYEDDSDILQAHLPKITLQPIVENAIIHGIEPLLTNGLITIKITQTKKSIIILISDNGIGVEPTTINNINKSLLNYGENNNRKGIALSNVNQRIKLLFGENYGITIRSVIDLGTDVEVTLPLIGEPNAK